MKIERIETQWDSVQVEEYCDFIRAEIARAFAVPRHLLSPRQYAEHERRAFRQTEELRRLLTHLIMTYRRPVAFASLQQGATEAK